MRVLAYGNRRGYNPVQIILAPRASRAYLGSLRSFPFDGRSMRVRVAHFPGIPAMILAPDSPFPTNDDETRGRPRSRRRYFSCI